MRTPDEILKCVAFLGVEKAGDPTAIHYGGTAFFVQVQEGRWYFRYLVTAGHTVRAAMAAGRPLKVRLNCHGGGADTLDIPPQWDFPQENSIDVAIFGPVGLSLERYDFKSVPIEMFLTDEAQASDQIGVGEDLVVVGLYTKRHGTGRNLPILRQGVLASMLDEPLYDPHSDGTYDAYLAEVRSIGGLSGSPVFVLMHPARPTPDGFVFQYRYYLLGLIRGHWDIALDSGVLHTREEFAALNSGIAIVTPAKPVAEILLSDRHREIRLTKVAAGEDKNTPRDD